MAKNVDVTVEDGFATFYSNVDSARRDVLATLLRHAPKGGVQVVTHYPRHAWRVTEDVAKQTGLLDTPKKRKPKAEEPLAQPVQD